MNYKTYSAFRGHSPSWTISHPTRASGDASAGPWLDGLGLGVEDPVSLARKFIILTFQLVD